MGAKEPGGGPVIQTWIEEAGGTWFGVAFHGRRLVATVVGPAARLSLLSCLPRGSEHREDEEGEDYPRGVVAMLARLEAGSDECPRFELCPDCVPAHLASVLRVAACIPRGYVTTYGRIATAAGTEARVVGRIMATNPLYPIVPCHRVVGADLALVGYSGRQDAAALRAKLGRLRAEARGYDQERAVDAAGGLVVTPAEWAIRKASLDGVEGGVQHTLW